MGLILLKYIYRVIRLAIRVPKGLFAAHWGIELGSAVMICVPDSAVTDHSAIISTIENRNGKQDIYSS